MGAVRFKFLDGLRGIAAFVVVLYHHYLFLNQATAVSFSPILEHLLLKGHLGVQIFFVLSGFVIAYSVRNATLSWHYTLQFFVRRSIRLDPPYWVALLCMAVATFSYTTFIAKEDPIFPWSQVLSNAFYVQHFIGVDSINPVAWTLCIELQLYLFFVCALCLLVSAAKAVKHGDQQAVLRSFSVVLFFVALFIVSLGLHFGEISNSFEGWSPKGLFLPYWYSFFIGTAVCWALLGQFSERVLAVLFGFMALFLAFEFDEQMFTCLLTAGTIYFVGRNGGLEEGTLSSFIQYLGKISFSLYLVHWLVGSNCIQFFTKRMGEMTMTKFSLIYCFSLALSIVAAQFFYQWIEAPCLRWSRNFTSKKLVGDEYSSL